MVQSSRWEQFSVVLGVIKGHSTSGNKRKEI